MNRKSSRETSDSKKGGDDARSRCSTSWSAGLHLFGIWPSSENRTFGQAISFPLIKSQGILGRVSPLLRVAYKSSNEEQKQSRDQFRQPWLTCQELSCPGSLLSLAGTP